MLKRGVQFDDAPHIVVETYFCNYLLLLHISMFMFQRRCVFFTCSNYLIFQITLDADQECPQDYELIVLTRVVLLKAWMIATIAKCKDKGLNFMIKKMIDGFFDPVEPIMAALRCENI